MTTGISADGQVLLQSINAKLRADETIDLEGVKRIASALRDILAPTLGDEELSRVVASAVEANAVTLRVGAVLVNRRTFVPWLQERKRTVLTPRASAYFELLASRGWSGNVIRNLDEQTDQLMDLVGDPRLERPWARRGLAIGEVQSGKTSNYLSLLAKAIDHGFKIIVVIGGHTEDLRRQTQARLDSDLTGVDSAYLADNIQIQAGAALQGIGLVDQSLVAKVNVLTTTRSDFSASSKRAGAVALGGDTPTIFVVKKNATVLQNLASYLGAHLPKGAAQPPLILVDDEADWASINIRTQDDVSAVNGAIRDILATSNRNSYLGITATPFANVFIDDEVEEDIFPRDFISVLESPSNYQGVEEYFSRSEHPALVGEVEDMVALLPYSHKRTQVIRRLPESLLDAIAAFVVGTAIRRIRDGRAKPASMLVNVSRFNDVQAQVARLVADHLDELCTAIVAELGFSVGSDHLSPRTARLKSALESRFASAGSTWDEVRTALLPIADEFRTLLVNSVTKAEREKHARETPKSLRDAEALLPTIYIGGDVLARGLTIEGLQVSYYVRRAGAADTLLQMGRWFGYRAGYEDLVRLWIDPSTAELFRWTADISAELRASVREMQALELTPAEFGLKVRRHPEGFQIAAASKLRDAVDHVGEVSINGRVFESTSLHADADVRASNLDALVELLSVLGEPHRESSKRAGGNLVWNSVERGTVERFLSAFRGYSSEPAFGHNGGLRGAIAENMSAIKNNAEWDVALVAGRGPDIRVRGIPDTHSGSSRNGIELVESGLPHGPALNFPNRRVAAGQDLASVIAGPGGRTGRADTGKPVGDRELARRALVRPTLLLYTVVSSPDIGAERETAVTIPPNEPLVAAVVATPTLTPEEERDELMSGRGVKWKVNRVFARKQLGYAVGGDDEEEDDE